MRIRLVPLFRIAAIFFLLSLTIQQARPQSVMRYVASSNDKFRALEEEMVAEINRARANPTEYAEHLERLRQYFDGKEFRQPGKPAFITEEGVAALDEAVRFLRASKPLPPLQISKGMCEGASILVAEQSASGTTGHKSADGSFCEQRVGRYGSWKGPIGENLSYGDDTARDRVIAMLIDDGVATRGHRTRLFEPTFGVIGIACGGHQLGGMCVITLAGSFDDAKAPGNAQPATKKLPAGARRF